MKFFRIVIQVLGYNFLQLRTSDGSYDIPEGLMYSFPVTCKDSEYEIVQGLEIDDFSRTKMEATQKELEEERDAIAKIL